MGFEKYKFNCGAIIDNKIYASSKNYNGLFVINTHTYSVRYIDHFPEEGLIDKEIHRNALVYNNLIIFVPTKSANVHVFDSETESFHVIRIVRNNYRGAYVGEIYKNFLFLFPEICGGDIIVLNLNSEMEEHRISWNSFVEHVGKDMGMLFVRIARKDNCIFLPINDTNVILEFNCDSFAIKSRCIDEEHIWGCFTGNNIIWLLSENGSEISCWNHVNNLVKKYNFSQEKVDNNRAFNWIVQTGNIAYVFPALGKNIMYIDNDVIKKIDCSLNSTIQSFKFYEPIISGNSIYCLPYGLNDLFILNDKHECSTVDLGSISNNSELYYELFEAYKEINGLEILAEGDIFSFNQFIQGI